MKTVKFASHLITSLQDGSKTTTWRLFDDKDLTEGDAVALVDKHTLAQVGTARIALVRSKALKDVTDEELAEHRYANAGAMYTNLRTYYGDRVTPETEVKMITFADMHIINPS